MPRKVTPPPVSLGVIGQEKWAELERRLSDRSALVLDQLLIYCRAFEGWSGAQENIDEPQRETTVKNDKGGTLKRITPASRAIAADCEEAMRRAAEFLEQRMG